MKNSITIVEIHDEKIKFAQFKRALNKLELDDLFVVSSPEKSESELAARLSSLIRERKIKIELLISSLPRYLATTRYLKIPSTDTREIHKMVRLQVGRQLPYPEEQIIYSFSPLFADKDGHTYVLLILVHKDVIRRHLSILKDAGLKTQNIVLSSEGDLVLFLNRPSIKDQEGIMLIDLDAKCADIQIILKKKLVFSRAVLLDSKSDDANTFFDNWCNKLKEEINRSLDSYIKQVGAIHISRIVLTASPKITASLQDKLTRELTWPIGALDPFQEVGLRPGLDIAPYLNSWDSFSSLIGLGLKKEMPAWDFLPADYQLERDRLLKRKDVLKTFYLFLALGLVFSLTVAKDVLIKRHYIKTIQNQYEKVKSQADTLETMLNKLKLIKGRFSREAKAVDIIRQLYKGVPDEVGLNTFSLEADHAVVLKGQAVDLSTVFKFVNILERSDYFENVQVRYTAKRRFQNQEITDFELVCPLSLRE
ncbi:MAG: PilN domain-containing protein [Candidatus Omnitrophota bacterium]